MPDTHLAVDEFDVVRALGVAVTGTVLGSSLVVREAGDTAVGVHLDEVESTVQTTGELRHVDVEGELLVLEVENLVLLVARVHEVDTGTNVGRVWAVGDELQGELVAAGGDAVGTCGGAVSAKYLLGMVQILPV